MIHESDLFKEEVERYSRQIIVPGVGIEGQKRLRKAKVLVVGCGGLGCPFLMYLATSGVVKIGIVDFDKVEIHNLQRQILFKEKDIGKYKVEAAGEVLKEMNSTINLFIYRFKVDKTNVTNLLSDYDIVVDCTDNIDTRYCLSDNSKIQKKHFICASVLRWEGHLYVLPSIGPCYRCLYPTKKQNTVGCDDSGIIGPICGVFGSFLCLEVMKLILGEEKEKMLFFNGVTNMHHTIKLRKSQCSVCKTLTILKDSVFVCKDKQVCETPVKEIDWEEVVKEKDSLTIVDVRNKIQHRMFRIQNSLNIPLEELEKNMNEIPRDKKIAVTCKRGISSKKAVKLLEKHGIPAISIEGGIEKYKECYEKVDKKDYHKENKSKEC